jgi:hypothetical protein
MNNHLFGLTNAETTKLNQVLDVLSVAELVVIATAVNVVCKAGFGSVRLVAKKGELRMDLSSVEMPFGETTDDGRQTMGKEDGIATSPKGGSSQ